MSKPLFKIANPHMARRVFRRTKSAAQLPVSGYLGIEMTSSGGLHELCSGLSQENIEKLSTFLVEANTVQAQSSRAAVDLEEALSYLKAAQFNSTKAVDIFKNYQKSRETYHLEDLKPYREPLCSGIGARKMEVVGTKDSEGYPIVLFTVSRHDSFKSDHKADMQLLFYTLEQAHESEAAQEKGIVFIIDFRDSHMTDLRYISSVVSVLKEGYPIHTKMIYIVSTKRLTKIISAFQRMARFDLDKMKIVDFADLGSYFLPEQLPSSLGGTFVPAQPTSPSHQCSQQQQQQQQQPRQARRVRDDSLIGLHRTPPSHADRRGSASKSKEAEHVQHPSANGGGANVNKLLGFFETSNDSPSSGAGGGGRVPPSPNRQRPVPPSKPKKAMLSQSTGDPQHQAPPPQGQPFQQVVLKKTSQQHTRSHEGDTQQGSGAGQGQAFQQVVLKKTQTHAQTGEGDAGKGKVPLFPPNGRPRFTKSTSVEGDSNVKQVLKVFSPSTPTMTKEEPGKTAGSKSLLGKSKSSGNAKSSDSSSPGTSAAPKKAAPISSFTATSQRSMQPKVTPRKNSSDDIATASCTVQQSSREFIERRRADSVGNTRTVSASKVGGASSGRSSPRKPHVPIQLLPATEKASPQELAIPRSSSDSSKSSSRTQKKVSTGYENVGPQTKAPPQNKAPPQTKHPQQPKPPQQTKPPQQQSKPPQTKPPPPQPDSQDYENLSFTNRDSDVYENFSIGFAGPGGQLTGPLPPLPPTKQAAKHAPQPAKQDYENIHFGKPSGKGKLRKEKVVEEDDETLFGKEGPPGMQETIYENFGPDEGNRPMTVQQMAAHVEKLGKKGLATEYLRVRNEPITGAHKACSLPSNAPKNRYKDVICYDDTRVQLSLKDSSDYIHANFVDGYKKPGAFILTQGPKDKTVADFWRMVWEKHILVIVMVTKCVEMGKRKCAQYWPESCPDTAKHGNYTVTFSKVQNCEGYDLSHLQLSFKGVERDILHFQFLAWPDYGIPSSGSSIIRLILDVRSAQEKMCRSSPGSHPIVVHCSAGVGRSGAFCSIDNCIHEIDEQKKVNFQGVVRKMRKQRAFAIQTEEQYEFCYRTLLEYAKR